MNAVLDQVLADLAAEGDALEALVVDLDEAGWRKATPAEGWDIATTIVHLAWTDECAIAAGTDKEAWDALVMKAFADPNGFVDAEAFDGAKATAPEILARWQSGRPALVKTSPLLDNHSAHEGKKNLLTRSLSCSSGRFQSMLWMAFISCSSSWMPLLRIAPCGSARSLSRKVASLL